MLKFIDFLNKRRQAGGNASDGVSLQSKAAEPSDGVNGAAGQQPTEPVTVPKIDSSNAIGSLAGILGPSPAERAAEEERQQKHRQKMHGWTALFNGLRHLSNLYYATKGAAPQKYSDPHVQIEQQYQDERKRLADIQTANQKYYTNMWELYRQGNDERRREALHGIQLEQAERQRRQDEDNARTAEAQRRSIDARTEYTLEQTRQLKELEALKKEEQKARTAKLKHDASRPYSTNSGKKKQLPNKAATTSMKKDLP